jgi:hypothetical protein
MAPAERLTLATLDQPLLGVLTDGLQHTEAGLVPSLRKASDQAAIYQQPDVLEHIVGRQIDTAADCFGRTRQV